MKTNLWSLIIAAGIIGLIIVVIRWNTSASDPSPAATAPPSTLSQPTGSPEPVVSTTPLITITKASTQTAAPGSTATPVVHIVQPGDTPYSLANLYHVPVENLMATNNISDPTRLQIGQELLIPLDSPSETIAAASSVEHIIENGDTLFALANRYGSSVAEILARNPGLEPAALQVGQTIMIPMAGPLATPRPNRNNSPQPDNVQPVENDILAREMINAVNRERQNHELPPLEANDQLAAVALAHGNDMVSRGFFDHVTPEGKTLRDRLQAHGLEPYWAGENIQRNTDPPDQTVQGAIEWFMNSPPHRDNILHTNFTHLGVGAVEGPPGWYTFVLVFAQP